ncbi:hypothetical protein Tco_0309884 [Tanacetum coccineum]
MLPGIGPSWLLHLGIMKRDESAPKTALNLPYGIPMLQQTHLQEKKLNEEAEALRKNLEQETEILVTQAGAAYGLSIVFNISRFVFRVDLLLWEKAIGTKWVYRNKKDERGQWFLLCQEQRLVLVAQGHQAEEGIEFDEGSLAPVANIDEEVKIGSLKVTPKSSHLSAVKRIFRYLKGKSKLVLWYPRVSSFDLESYLDNDYVGANLDRKSTTREAEYVAAASCCGQVFWIQNQMLDYGFNFMNTKIYIDKESTICIVKNSVYHSKTKHIAIRHHFIRDAYEKKLIQVLKIHTDENVADLLTKAFDSKNSLVKHFEDMRLCRPSKEYLLVWFDPPRDESMLCLTTKGMHTIGAQTLIAYLEKTEGNVEFHEVIDFLRRSYIYHALTVSPVVSTTFVEQFLEFLLSQHDHNVRHITATSSWKSVLSSEEFISEADLIFDDTDGIDLITKIQAIFWMLFKLYGR